MNPRGCMLWCGNFSMFVSDWQKNATELDIRGILKEDRAYAVLTFLSRSHTDDVFT